MKTCPEDHRHASTCYTAHSCRCTRCQDWQRRYRAHYRRTKLAGRTCRFTKVDARGARRRLQALVALGWGWRALEREAGKHATEIGAWAKADRLAVQTVGFVSDLYDRLSMTPPPARTPYEVAAVTRAKGYAADRGWLPPLAWDDIDLDAEPPAVEAAEGPGFDHAAVELAVAGQKPPLTPHERQEVVRRLHPRRWSDNRVARYIGCTGETVFRVRQTLGLPGWPIEEQHNEEVA